MFHDRRTAFAPFTIAALISGALTVSAQAGRLSYVGSTGSDANACTLAAPCRTLTHAIAATTNGGEVRLIDSAGYGASIAIGKSITVSGDGATVFAGPITIDGANAVVTLRGLVLNGGGTPAGSSGVTIAAATTVHIERCTIHGFPQLGVWLHGANAKLFFLDSIARDNGSVGLYVDASGAKLTADNARFENNGSYGLDFVRGATAAVTRAVAAGNGTVGYLVDGTVDSSGQLTLESSAAQGNTYGLYLFGGGTARISNSAFVNNGYGIYNLSGTVLTRQNNTVSGNSSGDTVGTLTPLGGI
jgi:hypothetical protein